MEPVGGSKKLQAHAWLRHVLVYQKVPPHTRLDLKDLANRLDMSRTPIRDALNMLADQNIILRESDQRFYSKPVNVNEIQNDYQQALVLLKFAIETCLTDIPLHGLQDPRQLFGSHTRNEPEIIRARSDYLENLFIKITACLHNHRILQNIRAFNDRTTFIRQLDIQQAGRVDAVAEDLAEFVNCLKNQDARGALANIDRQYHHKIDLLHELVSQANLIALDAEESWATLKL